jgi:hypothetical protein
VLQPSEYTRRVRLGKVLSDAGERRGWDWLTYNPIRFWDYHGYAIVDAPAVIAAMETVFRDASSYVDVGAGSCAYAAEASRRGHRAVAYERSWLGRLIGRRCGADVRPFDLNSPPEPSRFDLAYSFEVAEHLPPALGDRLVEFLAASGNEILFTAAPPGQGGTGHINEQPPEYWQERFERHGRRLDAERTAQIRARLSAAGLRSHWLPPNATIYI